MSEMPADEAALGHQALQAGKPDEARQHFSAALRAAEEGGDLGGALRCVLELGACDFLAGRLDEAQTAFERVLASPAAEQTLQARARGNLGLIEKERGGLAGAEQHFLAALALAEAQGDTLLAARQQGNLALVSFLRGRQQAGQAMLQQALESFQALGDAPGLVDGLLLLAETSLQAGEPQKAAWALGEAQRLAEQAGYGAGSSRGLELGGRLCEQLGEPAQAEALFERALQSFVSQQDRRGQAALLMRQADLLCQRGELGAAEARLAEAGRMMTLGCCPRAKQQLEQRRLLLRTRSEGARAGLTRLPPLLNAQRAAEDPAGLAGALLAAARLHLRAGALRLAGEEAREAQSIAESCALPEARLSALLLRTELACQALQLDEARKLLASAGGQATPFLAARAALLGAAARLDRLAGAGESAREHSQQALELWRGLRRPQAQAVELLRQARLERDAGNLLPAQGLLDRARQLFARCADHRGKLACRVEAGVLALAAGRGEEALAGLRACEQELLAAGELLLATRAGLWARQAGLEGNLKPVGRCSEPNALDESALLASLDAWLDAWEAAPDGDLRRVAKGLRDAGFVLHARRIEKRQPPR